MPGAQPLRWIDRMELEYRDRLPQCPECKMRSFHLPACSKAPRLQRDRGSTYRQRVEYRQVAHEMGCTCSDRLEAHTHAPGCPLERSEEEWNRHLDDEHFQDPFEGME